MNGELLLPLSKKQREPGCALTVYQHAAASRDISKRQLDTASQFGNAAGLGEERCLLTPEFMRDVLEDLGLGESFGFMPGLGALFFPGILVFVINSLNVFMTVNSLN